MPRTRKATPARPRRRSASEWAAPLDELSTSGLDLNTFADRRGVTAHRLRWWRWRLRTTVSAPPARDVPPDLRLVPLHLRDEATTPSTAAWELVTPHAQLRVFAPLDQDLLLRVVAQVVARP